MLVKFADLRAVAPSGGKDEIFVIFLHAQKRYGNQPGNGIPNALLGGVNFFLRRVFIRENRTARRQRALKRSVALGSIAGSVHRFAVRNRQLECGLIGGLYNKPAHCGM